LPLPGSDGGGPDGGGGDPEGWPRLARDAGVARLVGALGGNPRAKRWALVSKTEALTVAAVAITAKIIANFIVTG